MLYHEVEVYKQFIYRGPKVQGDELLVIIATTKLYYVLASTTLYPAVIFMHDYMAIMLEDIK